LPSQPQPEQWMAVDRHRLTSMIDKLVAVQMDLKPLCGDARSKFHEAKAQAAITEACGVLQSAIDDLKQVIFSLEAMPGMVESPSSSAKESGSK
jgi:hypothetical protein